MKNNEESLKKSNKGLIWLVIILILIVLGLSTYIVYDKVLIKENKQEETNKNTDISKKDSNDLKNQEKESNEINTGYKNGESIIQTDLQNIEDYFKTLKVNAFLEQKYNSITDIQIEELLKTSGIGIDGKDYCNLIGSCEGATLKVTKKDLEEYLQKYTGKNINDFSTINLIHYSKEYDLYVYPSSGPSVPFDINVVSGYVNGDGNYVINYKINVLQEENREVVLKKLENDYQFISNTEK